MASKAQTDGDDIVFTLNQGNQLDHEIESFDATTGTLVAWVKIPNLDGDQDSLLYMYYGNPTTDNQQKPTEVWDENFVGVWHMSESGSVTRYDSTRNDIDGTPTNFEGDEQNTDGKIGSAQDLIDNGDYITLGDSTILQPENLTVSMWIKRLDSWNGRYFGFFAAKDSGWSQDGFVLEMYDGVSSNEAINLLVDGSNYLEVEGAPDDVYPLDDWMLLTATFDSTSDVGAIYKDATSQTLSTHGTPDSISGTSSTKNIGTRFGNGVAPMDGSIDEVRISKVARSADWIETEFNNQDDPAAFITFASEEQGPSPVLYLPLDEGFGTTAHDESSAHNDATITGATWADEDMCKTGRCLQFDGNDYLEIDDDSTLDLTNEMTMEAWVKPTTTNKTNQTIISKQEKPDEPTKIYRSVGPSATTAITTGSSNEMTITGTTATFASSLPTNVGVGDAIQYDDDNDGDIDADDSIAFIKERVSSTEYLLQTSTGGVPTPVNKDTDWSLFRAYISLANWESGTENTGIDADLRAFDAGNRDIATNNEQWNVACYANGTTGGTGYDSTGWTTDEDNYIKIYTPTESNEVGASERHDGTWSTSKFYIPNNCILPVAYEQIVGLQIDAGNCTAGIYPNDDYVTIAHNIIKTDEASGIFTYDDRTKIYNNIFYGESADDMDYGIFIGGDSADRELYVHNNSFYNCDVALYSEQSTGGGVFAKNNIINSATDSFNGVFDSESTSNINELSAQEGAFGSTHATGTTDGTTASKLVDSTANLLTDGVQIGSIVSDGTNYSYVTALDSETTLSVNDDIFTSGESYSVYTNKYGAVTFENEGGDDFRLDQTDTTAIGMGVDLSADSNLAFTTDIEGDIRDLIADSSNLTATFDIGADEYRPTEIYRSVGPDSTDALEEGTDNPMTIVGDTATFTSALADNIGVGDAIQYDDDNDGDIDANDSIVFIHKRFSNYEYQVKTAAGADPVEADADTDWSLFRAYISLANWDTGTENTGIDPDLRAFDSGDRNILTNDEQWNVACYANGTTADSTATSIGSWTTGAENYIKIYTPTESDEVGESQRHLGVWDDNKYHMSVSNSTVISANLHHMRVEGLQLELVNDSSSGYSGIGYSSKTAGTGTRNEVSYNIIKGDVGSSSAINRGINIGDYDLSPVYIKNNIIYDFGTGADYGIYSNQGTVYVYNNTLHNCQYCIRTAATMTVKNNIASASTRSFYGPFTSDSDYNASNDSYGSGGGNDKTSQTFSFVDESGDDFHIPTDDTVVLAQGADLSADLNLPINFDIDGDKREGSFSIGADEGTPTKIYRSVGPGNTTALATGQGNDMTISGSTATFEQPLPNRIGVGDAIQYDDDGDGDIDSNDSIVFITSRISNFEFQITNSSGGLPTEVTSDNDWSIFRAYTALANAESGTENSAIDADLVNFDNFTGGKNLITSGEQWNVACYADSVDTATIAIDGWSTSEDNYIKIYTPNQSNEVGVSQRHRGIWSGDAYTLQRTISGGGQHVLTIGEDYVRIEGLQIFKKNQSEDSSRGIAAWGQTDGASELHIENNIIKGLGKSGAAIHLAMDDSIVKCANNVMYLAAGTSGDGFWSSNEGPTYVFNNTVFDSRNGFYFYENAAAATVMKNNIAIDNDGFDFTSYAFATGSTNNASSDGSANSATLLNGQTSITAASTFRNTTLGSEDLRLKTASSLIGKGVNLYADDDLAVVNDIEGESRPSPSSLIANSYNLTPGYDIGADQISDTDHDNYSMSLYNDSQKLLLPKKLLRHTKKTFQPTAGLTLPLHGILIDQYLYINGTERETSTIENFLTSNNGKLYIGAQDDNSNNSFQGFLDEIRIYNYARDEREITGRQSSGVKRPCRTTSTRRNCGCNWRK